MQLISTSRSSPTKTPVVTERTSVQQECMILYGLSGQAGGFSSRSFR